MVATRPEHESPRPDAHACPNEAGSERKSRGAVDWNTKLRPNLDQIVTDKRVGDRLLLPTLADRRRDRCRAPGSTIECPSFKQLAHRWRDRTCPLMTESSSRSCGRGG
jgi:hypothetical protein